MSDIMGGNFTLLDRNMDNVMQPRDIPHGINVLLAGSHFGVDHHFALMNGYPGDFQFQPVNVGQPAEGLKYHLR